MNTMSTFRFKTTVLDDGTLAVPPELSGLTVDVRIAPVRRRDGNWTEADEKRREK